MPQNDTPFTPKLTGHDYTTPDQRAKLTGTARFADDFRAEGMLICKLLTSPPAPCQGQTSRPERGPGHAWRTRHSHC